MNLQVMVPEVVRFSLYLKEDITLLCRMLCFICGRSWVQISAWRLVILSEVLCAIPESIQANVGIAEKV
jgi:hypothetical protein